RAGGPAEVSMSVCHGVLSGRGRVATAIVLLALLGAAAGSVWATRPGDSHAASSHDVRICKTLRANGDSADDGGSFGGSITEAGGASTSWSVSNVTEDDSAEVCTNPIGITAGVTFTVSEDSFPSASWGSEAGYPIFQTPPCNAAGAQTAELAQVSDPFAGDVDTVYFCNRAVTRRTVTLVKVLDD